MTYGFAGARLYCRSASVISSEASLFWLFLSMVYVFPGPFFCCMDMYGYVIFIATQRPRLNVLCHWTDSVFLRQSQPLDTLSIGEGATEGSSRTSETLGRKCCNQGNKWPVPSLVPCLALLWMLSFCMWTIGNYKQEAPLIEFFLFYLIYFDYYY